MKNKFNFQTMIASKDDKALLKMFHSYSLISTILNAIVFVVFILAFATIEQNGFLFFFVGSAIVVILQVYYPNNGRKKIAELFASKYKTASDVQTSPFYYLVRQEKRIYGKYSEKPSEKVFIYTAFAFRFANYIFNLVAALIATVFTGIIAVLFGGALYLLAIFANASGIIDAAKMLALPFKWTVGFFLKNALVPGSVGETDLSKYNDLDKPSSVQQNLSFNKYFSLGSLNLPNASAKLTTSFHGTTVTVSGTVYANKMVYSNQSNLYELQRDVENLITERFNEASRKFHNECPDSGDTHLDINIDCTLD